jgi:hypothetical protein
MWCRVRCTALVALSAVFETLEPLADLGDLLVAYVNHFIDTFGPFGKPGDGFGSTLNETTMPS